MDMQKIGAFLAELRKEHNLTQEELGNEIGVTNKTISRWEKGNYLPPVEMLQILSNKYSISINEILSGERLDNQAYKTKAEENITVALGNSSFTLKEKKIYYEKKWLKDHRLELVVELIMMISFAVICAIFCKELYMVLALVCLIWQIWIYNRRAAYLEDHLYGPKTTPFDNTDDEKGKNSNDRTH